MRILFFVLAAVGLLAAAPASAIEVIKMSPDMAKRMTVAIQKAGHRCPVAKRAFLTNTDRVGREVRVHCGETRSRNFSNRLVYRVTFLSNGKSFIKPWYARRTWPGRPSAGKKGLGQLVPPTLSEKLR